MPADDVGVRHYRHDVTALAGRTIAPLRSALLDRLTHHVHILELNGDSYRLAHSKHARKDAAAPAS